MSYFTKFPKIDYDVTGDKTTKSIRDFLIRVKIKKAVQNNNSIFSKYDVKEGQRPEDVAYEQYGDAKLHWIILMTNDMIDPYYDWPMGLRDLERFVKAKYTNVNAVHHYEVAQSSGDTNKRITVSSDHVGATAITNYEYEENLNANKKQIRVLDPQYVRQVASEFAREVVS